MNTMEFNLRIGPLPRAGGASRPAAADKPSAPETRQPRRRNKAIKDKDDSKPLLALPPPPGDWSGGRSGKGKKGKGKGKSKDDTGAVWVPKMLRPGVGKTADGTPICFAYNLEGCKDAPDGGKCARGRHVCTRIGCQHPHPAHACHAR